MEEPACLLITCSLLLSYCKDEIEALWPLMKSVLIYLYRFYDMFLWLSKTL